MDLGLDGATIVVAGGTSGMGRGAADSFAADGARVAVFARSLPDLDATASALAELASPDAVGLPADLFDHASASESFRSSLAQIPDVDENDLHDIMRYIGENFDNKVHLDRAAQASEIGPVIAFLASARNTYTTGANVNVDGGSDFT